MPILDFDFTPGESSEYHMKVTESGRFYGTFAWYSIDEAAVRAVCWNQGLYEPSTAVAAEVVRQLIDQAKTTARKRQSLRLDSTT